MQDQIFYKSDAVTLYLDEPNRLIHVDWHGYIPSSYYREIMEWILYLIQEKKLTRWITNMKHLVRIQIQDVRWREEEWFPKFIQSPIDKLAVVVSDDHFNETAIVNTVAVADPNSKINRARFTNLEDAKNWILSNSK